MSLGASSWLRAGVVAAVVVIIDQITKAIVRSDIAEGERDELFSFLHLVHVRNDGVAFGKLGGGGILVAIVVAAAVCALVFYFSTHIDIPLIWLPTGLLLGGAIGNIADRIRFGAVTDFVQFPHFPAFNVADSAITVGVVALLIVIERASDRDDS